MKFLQSNYMKLRNRLFSYKELEKISTKLEDEIKKEICSKYDAMYTLGIVNTLNAAPYNFGKKRICDVLNLFFEQIKGLNDGTIDAELLTETAEKLGVTICIDGNKFKVDLDSEKPHQKPPQI